MHKPDSPRFHSSRGHAPSGAALSATACILSSFFLAASFATGGCGSPGAASDTAADASSADADAASPQPPVDAGGDSPADADADSDDASPAADADATLGAGDSSPPVDGGFDASGADAPFDAPADAPVDAAEDAGFDAADAAPAICGDGVWNPPAEECDNGAANLDLTGACSATCQVQDFLASSTVSATDAGPLLPFQYPPHTLGQGRHPIAAGPGGFALTFLEQGGTGDFTVRAEAFDPRGARVASFPVLGTPGPAIANADPVVAAISKTEYVAVWGDTGIATVGPGVAMAILDPTSGATGAVVHANVAAESPETAPDALWVGDSLVVAWVDGSGASSDLKVRTFDATLTPTSTETYLASTAAEELDVSLAPFNGSWAAAWRASDSGMETVHVKAGSVEIVTNAVWGGPAGERPALVQVGPTTLFVAFAITVPTDDAGDQSTTILQGAVVDMTQVGATVTTREIALDAQADGGDGRFPEGTPAAVTAGGNLWLAAWTGAQLGDPLEDEVWLTFAPGGSVGAIGKTVLPLPRSTAHRGGDQRNPALAVTGAGANGAIAAAWEDYGASVGGLEARPDVVLEVAPLPIAR